MKIQQKSTSFVAWLLYSVAVVALLYSVVALARQNPPTATPTPVLNADAKVLQDFMERVTRYTELRKAAAKDSPSQRETKDTAKINAAQEILAAKIRAARAGAKHGDIFTPDIQRNFRRMLNPAFKGPDGAENRETIKDEAPTAGEVPYKVNAKYPDKAPLSTVPPDVLASLPKLPEDLQYRFVAKDLILYDVQADLIVDFVSNALP
jgi:hypothetical protein